MKTWGINELAVEGGAVAVAEVKATPTGQDVAEVTVVVEWCKDTRGRENCGEGFAFTFYAHHDPS